LQLLEVQLSENSLGWHRCLWYWPMFYSSLSQCYILQQCHILQGFSNCFVLRPI